MKTIFLSLFIAAICQVGFCQPKQETAAIKEVESLERKRFQAQVEKDYDFLEKVFSDDLIYTHSSGQRDDKKSYISSIKDGKSVYEKIEVEDLKFRAYNEEKTVVINGTVMITLPMKDGKPNLAHLLYAVVYIKDKSKGWQLVMWQSLKLAQ